MKNILFFFIISTSIFAQSGENLELLFNWNDPTIVGTTAYNNAIMKSGDSWLTKESLQ